MRSARFIYTIFFFFTGVFFYCAYSQGTAEQNPQSPAIAKSVTGQTYAMIIGISTYKYIRPLSYADSDAELFRDFLKSPGGGRLKDENVFCLLNEEAKAANFWVKGMSWLRSKNMKKGDRFYIYLAGHGDAINQDEYFFLTYDCNPAGDKNNYIVTGSVQLYNLKSRIAELSRNGVEVILIMDACRTNELPGGSDGQQILNSAISEKRAGEIIMLATGAGQESLEDATIGTGHGLFTYYLVDGLTGLADSIGTIDRTVTLAELKAYVGKNVPAIAEQKYKRKQNPFFCCDENTNEALALVDSNFLRKWEMAKKIKANAGNEMARNVRGRSLDMEPSDTQILYTYHQFTKAIKQLNLTGSDSSAEYYFTELNKQSPYNSITRDAKLTLIAEFINFAQTKINLYLQGKDAYSIQRIRSQIDENERSDEITSSMTG